ncbi:MAG: HAMP domain-containing histidine kinase [Desulfamplus sp.]|nr:HAMP domain-containing histidine kinase [Desulfamplus sp.]
MNKKTKKRKQYSRYQKNISKKNLSNLGENSSSKLNYLQSQKECSEYCLKEENIHSEEIKELIFQLEQLVKVNQLQQLVNARKNEIEYIRNELLNKAVDAGRAQLAAMILHNIGNAITPVAVYTEKLKLRNTPEIIDYIKKCYTDLIAHKANLTEYITDDVRGIDIINYMGVLIDNLANENRKNSDIIDRIATGVDYVAQILTLQRAYSPGKTEIREKININLLVKDALKMQEFSISKRDIILKTNLIPTIPYILMEKNKLMQVIVNLIKNSCDAIDENVEQKIHYLEITTYSVKNMVGLRIKDTGIGVEIERQKEIFDFGTSSKGSSGFGLYYCKSFIENNKGNLLFESDGRGLGSTVTIEFPSAPSAPINLVLD